MRDILSRMLSLELGLLSITRDKVKAVIDDLVRTGDVGQQEGQKLMDEIIARGDKSRQELKSDIEKMITDAFTRLNLPTRGEIDGLKADIIQLRKDLDKLMLDEVMEHREKV